MLLCRFVGLEKGSITSQISANGIDRQHKDFPLEVVLAQQSCLML